MIIRVTPDAKRTKSILKQAEKRLQFTKTITDKQFSTIIAESYYEIIKELISALFLINGYKAIGENSHKEMIESIAKYSFSGKDIYIIDDLRKKRNKSLYEGKQIPYIYIEQKRVYLMRIIKKLKIIIDKKML
jgi:hypothetical protein